MIAWPFLLALAIFVVDQVTKWAIINLVNLPARYSIELLPVLSLTWVENRGVSMGLLTAGSDAARWGLVALTAGIAGFVGWWLTRPHPNADRLALALVLGGALGNIIDRIRFGYVVDFIHLHVGRWSFYVFNVADAAITIGVAILFVRALMSGSGKKVEHN